MNKISKYGFTRLDLLITVTSLLLLFFIAITFQKNWQISFTERQCSFNIKRITGAIITYAEETGSFPAAARNKKPLTNDWIYWQPDRRIEDSPVFVYDRQKGRAGLVCPLDNKSRHRQYPYSYSMNINIEMMKLNRVMSQPELIIVYEEENPNDGACVPGASTDRLAYRHRRKTLVGRMDCRVELLSVYEATRPYRCEPKIKPE